MSHEGSTFDPLSSTTIFRGRLESQSTKSVGGSGSDSESPAASTAAPSAGMSDAELSDSVGWTGSGGRAGDELRWIARYRMLRRLGNGAQGVVYLADRDGADGYATKVAVKLFFRDRGIRGDEYVNEMRRIAVQAQRISEIQNDNIVTVRDFVAVDETRVMVMEWVDGFDLGALLDPVRHDRLRAAVPSRDWERLNDVVVSRGPDHCRIKPGIAVDIVRGCLAGLSDLHHHEIVHCDLKPSNIMIKKSGTKKIIDLDSSCKLSEDREKVLRGTPHYMAPEQLEAREVSYASDIASLGYVLIEMLTGTKLFRKCKSIDDLLRAKMALPERLEETLPKVVTDDAGLFRLCRKMVAVDPSDRFEDADAADLDRHGAASFHRRLTKMDMSTEYDRELAWWLDELAGGPLDLQRDS